MSKDATRNPRWLAYCAAYGRTDSEQIAYDKARYPGGCMAGYMNWIRARTQEWCEVHSAGSLGELQLRWGEVRASRLFLEYLGGFSAR